MFKAFDADRNRRLSFHEFIRGIQGSMDDARFDMVSKAFDKLDVDGVGVVTLEDMALCFNPSEDPEVKSGAKSERMVMLCSIYLSLVAQVLSLFRTMYDMHCALV